MATLGVTGLGSWLALRGDGSPKQGPPVKASSKEEEDFIQYVTAFLGTLNK